MTHSGLHRARNAVQHQGDIPSIESVLTYKGYTEDFFRDICNRELNIPYDELFLCQLVVNDKLRICLLQAEEAFGSQEFQQCIMLCESALVSAVFEEADIFYTAGMLTGYWGAAEELRKILKADYPEKYKDKDYYGLAKELHGAILQLGQATVGMPFIGERRVDFLKHRRIVEELENIAADDLKDSAGFSLNFVTDLILKWQEEGLFENAPS